MILDEAQRKTVAEWIAQGLKLSEIQNRLGTELGVRMTYMDVRLLVDDLKLTPKDVEPAKALAGNLSGATQAPTGQATTRPAAAAAEPSQSGAGGVSLSVDQLARPGALVSGEVTFSDGNKAAWYLDQTGRLGVVPHQQHYRPSEADVQQFRVALDRELTRIGF
jgi:hypothetical protein